VYGELLLIDVEELQILLEVRRAFVSVVPRQRRCDVRFRGVTAIVAMLRQVDGVAVAGDDVAQDTQARDARDVADDKRELDVHLSDRWPPQLRPRFRASMVTSRYGSQALAVGIKSVDTCLVVAGFPRPGLWTPPDWWLYLSVDEKHTRGDVSNMTAGSVHRR
jgi:hypothetical protein